MNAQVGLKRQLAAEWRWLRRKRAWRVGLVLAVVAVAAAVGQRALTSSRDVEGAMALAEARATEMMKEFGEQAFAPLNMFEEPRYLLASQLPYDLSSLALFLALIGCAVVGIAIGGEWRSGTVRFSWVEHSNRAGPGVLRLVVATAAWFAVSLAALALACGGLWLVAATSGLPDAISVASIAATVARGTLVGAGGAIVGGALSTLTRTDLAVPIALTVYLLLAELALPVALGNAFQPSTRLARFVVNLDPMIDLDFACGGPVCPTLHPPSAATALPWLVAGAVALVAVVVTASRSRAPVWR
ncbi:MAG: hypothetical protein LBK95_10410 [Bifidobacteriaceae bacterium]|jgi:hypothetical protein|nr:hypothetical protein [Bifidobacteriaceae bacterium]